MDLIPHRFLIIYDKRFFPETDVPIILSTTLLPAMFQQCRHLIQPGILVCTDNTGVDIEINAVGVNNYNVVMHMVIFIALTNKINLSK